jgi:hypothetical protein
MNAASRSTCPSDLDRRSASIRMRMMLAAVAGCIMTAAVGPAAAETEIVASQLAGRWVNAAGFVGQECTGPRCRISYDLMPCGEGWCGIEVTDGKTCGRVAFRLNAGEGGNSPTYGVEFAGSYERAEGTQPYVVRANLFASPAPGLALPPLRLSVRGSTDGDFQLFRRTYPLHMVLTRDGDAACAPPKVS